MIDTCALVLCCTLALSGTFPLALWHILFLVCTQALYCMFGCISDLEHFGTTSWEPPHISGTFPLALWHILFLVCTQALYCMFGCISDLEHCDTTSWEPRHISLQAFKPGTLNI